MDRATGQLHAAVEIGPSLWIQVYSSGLMGGAISVRLKSVHRDVHLGSYRGDRFAELVEAVPLQLNRQDAVAILICGGPGPVLELAFAVPSGKPLPFTPSIAAAVRSGLVRRYALGPSDLAPAGGDPAKWACSGSYGAFRRFYDLTDGLSKSLPVIEPVYPINR